VAGEQREQRGLAGQLEAEDAELHGGAIVALAARRPGAAA